MAFGASLSTAVRDSVGRTSCASHAMIRLAAARQSRPRPVNIASLPSAASMSPARAGASTDSLVRNLRRNAAIDFDDRAIHGSISSRSLRAAVASARVKWSSRRDRSRSSSTHCPWKFTFSVSSTSVRIRVSRLMFRSPRRLPEVEGRIAQRVKVLAFAPGLAVYAEEVGGDRLVAFGRIDVVIRIGEQEFLKRVMVEAQPLCGVAGGENSRQIRMTSSIVAGVSPVIPARCALVSVPSRATAIVPSSGRNRELQPRRSHRAHVSETHDTRPRARPGCRRAPRRCLATRQSG